MALALSMVACGGASPNVAVLGVARPAAASPAPRRLVVFVEVHNPMGRHLEFSRLEYRMSARPWFATDGRVEIRRAIGAGSSAVVEIEVPVELGDALNGGKVPYTLDGRLFAEEDQIERSWKVRVNGLLQGGQQVADSGAGATVYARPEAAVQVAAVH